MCENKDYPSVDRSPLERVQSRGKAAGRVWTPVGLPACLKFYLSDGMSEVWARFMIENTSFKSGQCKYFKSCNFMNNTFSCSSILFT